MKLSSISSVKIQNSQNNQQQKQTAFKGGMADALVGFWHFVDNGGRALQFTVEDMTGTNLPRSGKGLFAGFKYTKKLNIPAFLQEFIREFLTGPTMCTVPIVVLKLAKDAIGKTSNTHIENISNLSYLMGDIESAQGDEFKKQFYNRVAQDAIYNTSGTEASKEDVEKLSNIIEKYAKASYDKTVPKKESKKVLKKVTEEAQDTFSSIIKRSKDDYKDSNFLNVNYSLSKDKTSSCAFKRYIEYVSDYAHDFSKKYKDDDGIIKVTSENISKFKNSWMGKRACVVTAMFCITGFLMSFIPKIYTWASGTINPNASVIYNEAKDKNKTDKEVK